MIISIDGLDCSGKTTCAKILCRLTGFKYEKIKKASILDYTNCNTEHETTKRIIEEIYIGIIEQKENLILDRSFLSALMIGKIYDKNLNLKKLISGIPSNLIKPDLGLVVITDYKIALSRNKKNLTQQDKRVLSSNYYNESQKILISIANELGFYKINNNLEGITKLEKSLDNLLIKHFF